MVLQDYLPPPLVCLFEVLAAGGRVDNFAFYLFLFAARPNLRNTLVAVGPIVTPAFETTVVLPEGQLPGGQRYVRPCL